MTVFENVAFGLRVKPRRQRPPEAADPASSVNELLELVQLDWLADRYPGAAVGRPAPAHRARPRAGGASRACCCSTSRSARSMPRCARSCAAGCAACTTSCTSPRIFVTHDQDEALEVADRIVLMNKRHASSRSAPRSEVYDEPATPFVYASSAPSTGSPAASRATYLRVGDDVVPIAGGAAAPTARRWSPSPARTSSTSWSTTRDARQGLAAKVNRVLLSGATARVELTGIVGSNGHARAAAFRGRADPRSAGRSRPGGRSVGAADLVAAQGVPARTAGLIGRNSRGVSRETVIPAVRNCAAGATGRGSPASLADRLIA